jgi:hypothetical protein
MIAAIHQPQYLPWLGYFNKIYKADVFCYLDDVQYKKGDWQNRNRIKTSQGWQWITVPVKYRFPQLINEVEINNSVNWRKKHLQAIKTNYGKTPFFQQYIDIFEEIYSRDWEFISELNIYIVEKIRKMIGVDNTTMVTSSEMKLSDDPTDRLIDICKFAGADTYLSGQDGGKYMNMERFSERCIKVIVQDFKHPVYPQKFGDFTSHMSIIDLLFNCGPESLEKIKGAHY